MTEVRWTKHWAALGRGGQHSWIAQVGDREVMIRKRGRRYDVYRRIGQQGLFRAAPFNERTFRGRRVAMEFGERWLTGAVTDCYGPDALPDPRVTSCG